MIRREAPDVFGVQEGLIDQLHYIDTECCLLYTSTLLGAALGALGGYLYWYFVGCADGTCPIT